MKNQSKSLNLRGVLRTVFLIALLGFAFPIYSQEPPKEAGNFRKPELVELIKLDPTIKLDIRYATSNNFLGRPVYTEARAFLQKPAAEALVRANKSLRKKGYGLIIHDGGESFILIQFCPWCGKKLSHDRRDDLAGE